MPHSQRQGASLCLVILLLLPLQLAGAEIITIDAATVEGIVPAIHGVTQGPIISSQSIREPPCRTRSHSPTHASNLVRGVSETQLQVPIVDRALSCLAQAADSR